jgi:hypothetical protein
MTNIVGKIMLPDISHGCQDEYAAMLKKTRRETEIAIFTTVSGKRRAMTPHVNLSARGADG